MKTVSTTVLYVPGTLRRPPVMQPVRSPAGR